MSEARREANDLFFGAGEPDPSYDEIGDFRVRVVHQADCEERIVYANPSLRCALHFADLERVKLSKPWRDAGRNPAAHVHVGVIDMNDPERGELDWDIVG